MQPLVGAFLSYLFEQLRVLFGDDLFEKSQYIQKVLAEIIGLKDILSKTPVDSTENDNQSVGFTCL